MTHDVSTVFSYIVQRRLSRQNENVATDAFAYILGYSKLARDALLDFLRLVVDLPELHFRTQQTKENARPDICGYHNAELRLLMENKFWAGLTERQPGDYLDWLAETKQQTILLFVAPEGRIDTLWRELMGRLGREEITGGEKTGAADIPYWAMTTNGPAIAITSWKKLLSHLERAAQDEPRTQSDLAQLRALCQAADTDVPISSADVTDQRTPALVLQLGSIVQLAVQKAAAQDKCLFKGNLRPQANRERIGQYAVLGNEHGVGIWIGIHFDLWKTYGESPLWAVFSTQSGRAGEVQPLLNAWGKARNIRVESRDDGEVVVALNLPLGVEKEKVVAGIVDRLEEMGKVLSSLERTPASASPPMNSSASLSDELREFVRSSTWTFAKTMPKWPHEYIVRDRVDETLFVQLVCHIREHGYQGAFYQKSITYFDHDGMVYWTMGSPVSETTIINRCKKEDSYEYRLLNNTLPAD